MENSGENDASESNQSSPLPEVVETILFKKVESKFTRLFKKFMPRYFCFDRVYREFSYTKSEADPKIIKLHTKEEIINYSPSVDKGEELSKLFKYGFKVFTTTRTYILFTNEKNDYDNWMRMFNFYFYGVDPVEEKEKLKLKIKKAREKLYYPHHQFQFFKNVSFTLLPKPKVKNNSRNEIEEILFYKKEDEDSEVEGGIRNNQDDTKEKAILLNGIPLKENKDFNRKKVNLVKRYFRTDKLEKRDEKKSLSNSMINIRKFSNHSKHSNQFDNSNINHSNHFAEEPNLFEIKSQNNSNLMFENTHLNNKTTSRLQNINFQEINAKIPNNIENLHIVGKRETNEDFEMVKQINKKYKELLIWPVEEDY